MLQPLPPAEDDRVAMVTTENPTTEPSCGRLKYQAAKIPSEGGLVKVPSGKRLTEHPDVGFAFYGNIYHIAKLSARVSIKATFSSSWVCSASS